MRMNLNFVKSMVIGSFALIPVFSDASTSSCDQLHACNNVYAVKARETQVNSEKKLENQQQAVNKSSNHPQKDELAFYLEQLQLTQEQLVAIHTIQQSQVPQILLSIRNLEEAHTQLRSMAIKNAYDQTTAEALTNAIANHTANLAILQAQREYEIFSMLNEAQVKRYHSLVSQFN